jgi:hypothetical protein
MLIYYQSKATFSRNYLHLGLLIIQIEKMIYSVFFEGGLVIRQLNKRLIMLIPVLFKQGGFLHPLLLYRVVRGG